MAAAVPFLAAAARLAAEQPTLWSWGDNAIIELSVIQASRGDQLLGPFSRFGWHHPGPAYFYALVPFYQAFAAPIGLYVGASVLNATSAAAVVAVARRHGHRLLPLAAAVAVLALGASFLPHELLEVWNPLIIVLPFGLFLLLCAASGRSAGALVGAAAVGSVLVQTHVGVAPSVAILLAVALVVRAGPPWRWRLTRRSLARALGGAAVLGALWALPVAEELTGEPGNLTEVVRFLSGPGDRAAVGEAVTAAGEALGRPLLGVGGELGAVLVIVACAGAVLLVAVRGRRPEDGFARRLGAVAVVAVVMAVLSATRVIGEPNAYLFFWVSVIPVVVLLALGQWGAPRLPGRWRGAAAVVLAGLGVVLAGVQTGTFLGVDPLRPWSNGEVEALSDLALAQLPDRSGVRVAVDVTSDRRQPMATGLVLELFKAGYRPRVTDRWAYHYDARFHADGTEPVAITLADASRHSLPGFRLLGRTADAAVFYRDRSARPPS